MSDPVGSFLGGTGKSGAGKNDQLERHTTRCKETSFFLNRQEPPTPLVSIRVAGFDKYFIIRLLENSFFCPMK